MKVQPVRLQVQLLEGRAVPSTTPILPSASPHVAAATQAASHPHALAGVAKGSYICTLEFGTTPSGFHFNGTANLKGAGKVEVFADVYGVGFREGGHAQGRITISNAQGTIVLQLTGPAQHKLATLPSHFHYKVVGATGAYRQMKDSGDLSLVRIPDPVPVRGGIRFFEAGAFRLII